MDAIQVAFLELWTIFKANFSQIAIAFSSIVGTVMVGYLASLGPRGANRIARERLEIEQQNRESEDDLKQAMREQADRAAETREMFQRQDDLYEKTHKLVATLERRLELQTKEANEEREMFKSEIKGFRKQVFRLERRVAQLVMAFRDATGREPPPAPPDKDDDEQQVH